MEGEVSPTRVERIPISAKEAGIKLGEAHDLISGHLQTGFFGKAGEEKYEQAELASKYKGTGKDSTPEESDQLFAIRNSTRELLDQDPQAKELHKFFSDNLVVDIQEGDKTARLSILEFEKKLEAIQTDPSLSEEQKRENLEQLKQKARCGFLTQKEQAQDTQEKPQDKSAENIVSQQLSSLERQLKEIKKQGGKISEKQEKLLVALRGANAANGEIGILVKKEALELLKANGELGIDNTIQSLNQEAEAARNKFFEHLKENNWSEEDIGKVRGITDQGKLMEMIKEGKFPEVKGLDVLIFGKEMSEEELKKIFDPEDKKGLKGGSLLIALLVLAFGSMELAKQAIPTQNQ